MNQPNQIIPIGENLTIEYNGKEAVIRIADIDAVGRKSSTGTTNLFATTGGAIALANGRKLQINGYYKPQA